MKLDKHIRIRISHQQYNQLVDTLKKRRVNKSEFIRKAIKRYLQVFKELDIEN